VTDRAKPPWPLFTVRAVDGSVRRVGDAMCQCAGWLADGRIICAKGTDLYLVNPDGTEFHKVATSPGDTSFPRSSPDGRLIRFVVDPNELWEVAAGGSNLHPLLPGWNNPPAEDDGSWTADGRYYLFQSTRKGVESVWAIGEKGDLFHKPRREPVQLTFAPMIFRNPIASRDGKKIFALGALPSGELMRYDAKSRHFQPYLIGLSVTHVDFSRDGMWMTYVAYPERTLWKSRPDGSERAQLTFPPIWAFLPRWSPDGKRIVFKDMNSNPGIMIISSEGGTPEPLPLGPRKDAWDPGWSPDGKSIIFDYRPTSATLPTSIHLYDLATRHTSELAGSEGINSPRWSPDGRILLGVTSDDQIFQNLMLFNVRSRRWSKFSTTGYITWAMWSRDSRYVYFINAKPGNWAVYRAGIANRVVERVLSLNDVNFAPGSDGWFGLTPDDSVLVLKGYAAEEVYALDWEAP
jgi:eukaryotic-like serine/threonine-protein kinase